ncbi:hypothetical protein [Actinosynnema mirum]|uniref:Uncharacterized protein n=1 Tax=Actinosynnema mirum (strain ATCC 29888 / DSM 43827 / JCM 3225 / NBRC 14064 / NCIMB 13271 / NRRL B-12336 / IMRU 3971 / 101) TaxID=446462 RepID=C6W8R1_ACTMD|nr:hypothetical protein [Actinosynnema mirum]ACU37160.1 hypothetical protein Amir_3253 [Actinosynnema mirum DSM 43827]
MTGALPVPVDVADLVVRALRPLLTARAEPAVAGIRVATRVGDGPDGGPPSLPWLLVAEDSHTWTWPAVQRAVVRLTCWHRTEHEAKAALAVALALLCVPVPAPGLLGGDPVIGPLSGIDPHTARPLATAAAVVRARTPAHRPPGGHAWP